MTEKLAALLVATYLIGSINFSVLVLKVFSKGDPREWDSHNPGTFNVYRRLGWLWAAPILFLDIARALGLAAAALSWAVIAYVPLVGLILVIANRFPVFYRFNGGKGVAAYLGFSIMISPIAAVASAAIWLVLYRLSGQAFIGSFGMILTLAYGTIARCGSSAVTVLCVAATCSLIVYAHRSNIKETRWTISSKDRGP